MTIDKTNAILSLEPGASFSVYGNDRIEWNSPDITQPTDDEINAEVTRLQGLEAIKVLREERNRRLQATDWRASSDLIMSEEWKIYRQRLRDLPAGNSPDLDSIGKLDFSSVNWPTLPS